MIKFWASKNSSFYVPWLTVDWNAGVAFAYQHAGYWTGPHKYTRNIEPFDAPNRVFVLEIW